MVTDISPGRLTVIPSVTVVHAEILVGSACDGGPRHRADILAPVAPIVPTPIKVQALAKDGVTLQGSPTTILNNDGAADQGVVEAPSLAHMGNTWVLFFSNSCFTTNGYTVSYATASSITGPYTRAARPLFQTGDYGLTAPGSADIDHDGKHLLFHANYGSLGSLGTGRALYQAQITLNGNTISA